MNFDDLKTAWKCQNKIGFANLNPDQLLERLKFQETCLNRIQTLTNLFVAGFFGLFLLLFYWFSFSGMEIMWPFHLAVVLTMGAVASQFWNARRWKKKTEQYGNSLQEELRRKSGWLAHQICFSSWGQIWFYLLPIVIALSLFYWQWHINGDIGIEMFYRGVVFTIVVGGFLAHGIGWWTTRSLKKQKRQVDLELEALGCAPSEENTPLSRRVARTLLVVGALVLCVYLLLKSFAEAPRADGPIKPDPRFASTSFNRRPEFAKVAPFTGVRWDSAADQPTVRVRGEWLRLTAVEGIPIDRLMHVAREKFHDLARKRFAEDLVELLAAAGHTPGWTVTLMLDRGDGKGPVPFKEEMTERKREAVRILDR